MQNYISDIDTVELFTCTSLLLKSLHVPNYASHDVSHYNLYLDTML